MKYKSGEKRKLAPLKKESERYSYGMGHSGNKNKEKPGLFASLAGRGLH